MFLFSINIALFSQQIAIGNLLTSGYYVKILWFICLFGENVKCNKSESCMHNKQYYLIIIMLSSHYHSVIIKRNNYILTSVEFLLSYPNIYFNNVKIVQSIL